MRHACDATKTGVRHLDLLRKGAMSIQVTLKLPLGGIQRSFVASESMSTMYIQP